MYSATLRGSLCVLFLVCVCLSCAAGLCGSCWEGDGEYVGLGGACWEVDLVFVGCVVFFWEEFSF